MESLKLRLSNQPGQGCWVLLSNYSHSSGAQYLSDEIDLVVVGPPGVFLVEIKHWGATELKQNHRETAETEADKLNAKARRVAGRLRRICNFDLGFVVGKFLFTKNESDRFKDGLARTSIRGIEVFGLKEWADLLEIQLTPRLSNEQIEAIGVALQPTAHSNVERQRAFENFYDLEELPGWQEPFHHVYRGRRKQYRDRIILHLYDLTALSHKDAVEIAAREFKTLQAYQKSPWLPSLLDSFQPAKSYPGEFFFFSYFDTEAPTIAERANDQNWLLDQRLHTALQCLRALQSLHTGMEGATQPVLHRNLTPLSIRVRSNGEPLLTQLHAAKLTGAATVAGAVSLNLEGAAPYLAPEVRQGGLTYCTPASDVYSLCATLQLIFEPLRDRHRGQAAWESLSQGLTTDPQQRENLAQVVAQFEGLCKGTASKKQLVLLPPEYWDETTEGIEFKGNQYRILTRLGKGGFGITFKVMEIDLETGEEISGPYVAKVINNKDAGRNAALNYKRVRAQTHTPHLAGILEVASEWQPDGITALLKWVDGCSLDELAGVLPLYFEDLAEANSEAMLLRWLVDLCDGLASLHRAKLVHGDVSPKNIIVDGGTVILTDFDLSGKTDEEVLGGTEPFCAPEISATLSDNNYPPYLRHQADDLYALGASIFQVLFDRHPFDHASEATEIRLIDKKRGLAWEGFARDEWPLVAQFLDRATHTDPSQRFDSAMEALDFLAALTHPTQEIRAEPIVLANRDTPVVQLSENHVPWLSQLLQSYPGSTKGNAETRGLDSPFARQTYVETQLDEILVRELREREVSLVILCGNAGDGKTAFLQNLARRLGLTVGPSSQRLWNYTLKDGLRVRANLDGSASYQGQSAKALLDDFFAPFQDGQFPANLAHLIAINDGPLLAWLNEGSDTSLTKQLRLALSSSTAIAPESRIRFINLNARSLVGGLRQGNTEIHRGFLDELLAKMLGNEQTDAWQPCQTCSAQSRCSAWYSVRLLRDNKTGPLLKNQLTRALLAVHQRGEIHITARNLRAALVYIFFGTHDCTELHEDPNLPVAEDTYYNRALKTDSKNRQGELLGELQKLDPALESHPRIDRYLLNEAQAWTTEWDEQPQPTDLPSLRRRAWFEWPAKKIEQIAGRASALTLARGKHLDGFLRVVTGTDKERQRICTDLCKGLARLEDLPEEAYHLTDAVPLRVTPRTPTETAFWVSKPRERFQLRAVVPFVVDGIEALHTHLELSYCYEDGGVENLLINAELFHLLMELKEGYQISDAQSDDIFANLSIFKQRIAQEADHLLYAWSTQDECVFKIRVGSESDIQQLIITEEVRSGT